MSGRTALLADDGVNQHDILFANVHNDFHGTVTAAGQHVVLGTAHSLGVTAQTTGHLTLTAGGALQLGNSFVGGNLNAQAQGIIAQDPDPAAVVAAGATLLAARSGATLYDIVLNNANNDFAGLATVDGQNVALNALNGLGAAGQTSGNLELTAGWTLTVSGQVGGDLVLSSINTTTLNDLSVSGNLTALSWGAIVQGPEPAAVKVTGTAALSANDSAVRYDLVLANAGNDFGGAVNLDGANVILQDANNLTLGTATAAGTFQAMPGGVAPTLRLQGNLQAGNALTLGGAILVVPDGSSYTLQTTTAPGNINLGVGFRVQAATPAPPAGQVQLTIDAEGGLGSFRSGTVDGSVTLHVVGH